MGESIQKSICWIVLMVIFGLAQHWFVIAYQFYNDPTKLTYFFLIEGGAFHFLCLALISGLTIDYWLDCEEKSNLKHKLTFVFFPMISLIAITASYFFLYLGGPKLNKDALVETTFIIIIITVIYSLCVKIYMFLSKQVT